MSNDDYDYEQARRNTLEQAYPNDVYNTQELKAKFEVKSFAAPYVFVKRKSDGAEGFLRFEHMPRFYFGWSPNG
jgi:hypothetical protein